MEGIRTELPGSALGGTVFLEILVEFLIGKCGVARKGLLRGFQVKVLAQFLIAKVGRVLVRHALLNERLIGNREGEFAVLSFLIHDQVEVIPASRLQLKTQILDLHRRLHPNLSAGARILAGGQDASVAPGFLRA